MDYLTFKVNSNHYTLEIKSIKALFSLEEIKHSSYKTKTPVSIVKSDNKSIPIFNFEKTITRPKLAIVLDANRPFGILVERILYVGRGSPPEQSNLLSLEEVKRLVIKNS